MVIWRNKRLGICLLFLCACFVTVTVLFAFSMPILAILTGLSSLSTLVLGYKFLTAPRPYTLYL